MAEAPDNLVLRMLREIRGELTGIREKQDAHDKRFDAVDARFDAHDKRFDAVDKRMGDMQESLIYALGFATHGHLRHENMDAKIEAIEARLKRLEERV